MIGKSSGFKKKKYIKPFAKVKSLTAELRRNKQEEVGLFNLLAATCDWEAY